MVRTTIPSFPFQAVAVLVGATLGVVGVGYCNDKSPSCGAWAKDGECSGSNSEYLSVLCPHSCATCTLTCEDSDEFQAEVERLASFYIDTLDGTFRIDPGANAERRSSWVSHGLKLIANRVG